LGVKAILAQKPQDRLGLGHRRPSRDAPLPRPSARDTPRRGTRQVNGSILAQTLKAEVDQALYRNG